MNYRLCRLRLTGMFWKITVISDYSPTNNDDVYNNEQLDDVSEKTRMSCYR